MIFRTGILEKYSHDLNAIITVDTHARVRGAQIDTNSWRHGVCVWSGKVVLRMEVGLVAKMQGITELLSRVQKWMQDLVEERKGEKNKRRSDLRALFGLLLL